MSGKYALLVTLAVLSVGLPMASGGPPPAVQACCLPDGGCANLEPFECEDMGGYSMGDGSMCLGDGDGDMIDDACEAIGGCCLSDGTCVERTFSVCLEKQGGNWFGPGSTCLGDINGNGINDLCEPNQACCLPLPPMPPLNMTCVYIPPEECVNKFGGSPQGPGMECLGDMNGNGIDDVCENVQGCCLPNGTCMNLDVPACLAQGGQPQGEGQLCTAAEACCLPSGSCSNLDPLCCADLGGTSLGMGTICGGSVEACCFLGGSCMDLDTACCSFQGGTSQGMGTLCLGDTNMNGTNDACEAGGPKACCLPNGTCINTPPSSCLAQGGTPQMPGSVCTAPQACCLPDGTCADLDPLCCDEAGGTPGGPNTMCGAPEACCLANETCIVRHAVCCALQGGMPQGVDSMCEPPTIVCPPDAMVSCGQPIDPANTGNPMASDDCDGTLTIGFMDMTTPGNCPQEFTVVRTWTATDADGNVATCMQTITVDDFTPPTIMCPADTSVPCNGSTDPSNTGTATAMDDCDPMPMVGFMDAVTPGACPQERTIARTWTATDACGNANSCLQTITVVDDVPPMITCPMDVTVDCEDPTDPSATGNPSVMDNCDSMPGVGFMDVVTPGACPQERTIARTWTATDACGNANSCLQTITVVDDSPPTIMCPGNVTVPCNSPTDPSVTGTATGADNCDMMVDVGFVDAIAPGSCPQERTITRTWTATDDCGLSSSCDQIITVVDDVPPMIMCPAAVNVTCPGPNGVPVGSLVLNATATDNCDMNVDIDDDRPATVYPPTCGNMGTVVTFIATDDCGNSSQCQTEVRVTGDNCCEVRPCCLPNGSCANLTPSACLSQGGSVQPGGLSCTAPRACCLPGGTCQLLDPLCCTAIGGTPQGPGSVCGEDSDGDGVSDCLDRCPGEDDTIDADGNGVPDCDETPDLIPTVSQWGLMVLALLLLSAGKIYFGRRRAASM